MLDSNKRIFRGSHVAFRDIAVMHSEALREAERTLQGPFRDIVVDALEFRISDSVDKFVSSFLPKDEGETDFRRAFEQIKINCFRDSPRYLDDAFFERLRESLEWFVAEKAKTP